MTLQPADLDRLEQLLADATDAPWQWLDSGGDYDSYDELQDGHGEMVASGFRDDINLDQRGVPGPITDGRLCAALRNAASVLVAAARLGAAWQEAEAALPEGWRGPWLWPDPEEGPYVADAASGEIMPVGLREVGIRASGPTPAAALLALAEALRGRTG